MSTLAKLAKEIDEPRNIGQTTAECQLMVWPSRKSRLKAESARTVESAAEERILSFHTEMSEKGEATSVEDRHHGGCRRTAETW